MTDRLGGKVVFVTGASGIAAAGARRYAAEGASVFIISRSEDSCESLAAEIESNGGTAGWAAADLTAEDVLSKPLLRGWPDSGVSTAFWLSREAAADGMETGRCTRSLWRGGYRHSR